MVIIPYHDDYKNELRQIADSLLGQNYFNIERLSEKNVLCVIALENNKCIGFVYGQCDREQAMLETICVHPDLQQQGIGFKLAQQFLNTVLNKNPKKILSPAWKNKNNVPADRLLQKLGFAPAKQIDQYWYEDSRSRGYQCPSCGNPCQCSAIMYKFKI